MSVDSVHGHVVGGDFGVAWISYDGRKQRNTVYPRNKEEAVSMLDSIIGDMKKEYGESFAMIFPEQKWKYHINGA